ncbi:MAG: flagellar motor switch protein FliN [Proteobacteria bacterium]|nr:flagellar motor switch protein FliN [Pseudomonadota bacterium]NBY19561.1 flagellar motor switch protein FliN [bacterium]
MANEGAKNSNEQNVKPEETVAQPELKLHVNPQSNEGEHSLDLILDIPLKVSVELGRTKILVQDLLKLHKGSVIELTKLAGEPLEVLVNDKVVAKGEVIVVNEKFGLRLTDIVSHAQRIRQLGESK